ncbi:MAG TPA: PEP-CTERM sorting domain-containing protein [Leptolyngbyaceae cyanobacterium]
MNIYSKLAFATAQSSALLATLGILGITPPAIAASLTFELSGNLVDDVLTFFPQPLVGSVGSFTGTFSYDPEAADLIPEPNAGQYPISEFSIIFRDVLGNQIDFVDSDNETCNCLIPSSGSVFAYDDDSANLVINPNRDIVLNFSDDQYSSGSPSSLFIRKRVSLKFRYESATDALPSTTEEFLANVGNFITRPTRLPGYRVQPVLPSRIYETDINGINGIEYPYLYSTRATITAASQPVPEPSGVGAFSLLTLGFFLKKKETSSRKAKAIAKV